MPTTPNYSLPFPSLSDPPNVPADLEALAEAADAELLRIEKGTGVRNVSSELINGWTGTVHVARVGNLCTVQVYSLVGSGATGNILWAIPAGFGVPVLSTIGALGSGSGPATEPALIVAGSGLQTLSRDGNLRGQAFWWTTDPWPTVLPGVPV